MTASRLAPTTFRRIRDVQEVGIAAALLVICVVLAVAAPDTFLRTGNLLHVARQSSDYGIMAVGMVFVLAMGDVDLSVGSVVTLVNIVTAMALGRGWPLLPAVGAGLAVGTTCGLVNGLLSVALRVPTIIVTLGTMGVYRSLALILAKLPVGRFPKDGLFFRLGGGEIFYVPTGAVVMLAVAAAGYVLFNHTRFGWRVQAIGSNAQAARFSGIPIARYRVGAMGLMGAVAAIAGLAALAFNQSASRDTGLGAELLVIAAAIIGGTSLSGGGGSIPGAVLGALIIAIVHNGLAMLGLPAEAGGIVTGSVIIGAVAVGTLVRRR